MAPVSESLKQTLSRLQLHAPTLPIVANVDGEFYLAEGPDVEGRMLDILGRQVASPVQFVKGLHTLYEAGARVFVEVGPKTRAAGLRRGRARLGARRRPHAVHQPPEERRPARRSTPRCAACTRPGLGGPVPDAPQSAPAPPPVTASPPVTVSPRPATVSATPVSATPVAAIPVVSAPVASPAPRPPAPVAQGPAMSSDRYSELGHLVADLLERGRHILNDGPAPAGYPAPAAASDQAPAAMEPVVITGAALGLPGVDRIFDDENVSRILAGQQFIDLIPRQVRRAMVDKHITRLVKSERGDPVFETIDGEDDVIKLAGRYAPFNAVEEFGIDPDRDAALDSCTRLAISAGIDALRDAGIPLVRHYHTTTLGTQLPGPWGLPDDLRDDTGVVFASAFPGYESFVDDLNRYHEDRARRIEARDARGHPQPDERHRPGARRGGPPDRRTAARAGDASVHLRPPLPVPDAGHGSLAVRRADRRPRAEHPGELGLREHRRRGVGRRGLDPGWPLPPGDHRVRG